MFRTPKTPRKRNKPRGAHARPDSPKVKSESDSVEKQSASDSKRSIKTARSNSTSSTLARQKLEFEAAQAKALLEIEVAQVEAEATAAKAEAEAKAIAAKAEAARIKAAIQADLVQKKLAADIEILEHQSNQSQKSTSQSSTDRINDWLNKTEIQQSPPRPPFSQRAQSPLQLPPSNVLERHQPQPSEIEKLANALKEAITASSPKSENKELLTRLATSKDLPIFFGDPLEWLQFKQAFNESTTLCKYSESENMWRLRKCLRGEAKEAVSALLIGNTTPNQIIDTLELRFGRPEFIMSKLVSKLKKLQPLSSAFHNDIVNFAIKITNYVTAAKAIMQNDYLRSPELVSIVVSKFPNTLVSKWTDYVYEHRDSDVPKLEQLSEFLYTEANKTAISGVSYIHSQSDTKRRTDERKQPQAHTVLLSTESEEEKIKCKFCRVGRHELFNCPRFKRALRRDRWRFARTQQLCYKCLDSRHSDPTSCQGDSCDIEGCGQPHHRLLHWITRKDKKPQATEEKETSVTSEIVTHTITTQCPKVLLKIVPLTIHGPNGSSHAHALLDDGATVTLIAADIANKVGLHGEKLEMRARSAWDAGELVCVTELVNFEISNSVGNRFCLRARKISELNLPVQKCHSVDLSKYENIPKDFSLCDCNVQPTLLIGQDNHHLIAPVMCIRSEQRAPYITKTAVGWCIHGNASTGVSEATLSDRFISLTHNDLPERGGNAENIFHLFTIENNDLSSQTALAHSTDTCDFSDVQLHNEIRKSFALESIGICSKPRQSKDEVRALSILDKTSTLVDGRWTVGLPWKYDDIVMPDSYPNAYKRLKSVERKMSADSEYALRYRERIQHLFSNDYARELCDGDEKCSSDRIWYLPHFGVDNPNKKKLRLVYDAAAKSNGYCLNDFLLQGPDLLQSLLGIMLRFRENPIGIIGDIKDMFLQIKIRQEDINAFRFLWRDIANDDSQSSHDEHHHSQKNRPVKKYVMTSLIFGANCSPFIAQYINQNKNTERFYTTMPEAVNAIRKNTYMDDYIDSLPDKNTTLKMINDISFIHQQGGFLMRNWLSNSTDVLCGAPKETLSDKAVRFNVENQPERTLGLLWYPATDTLGFDLSLKRIPTDVLRQERKPTKREMLRIIMSIYDIHGFLGPFTVQAKILMQNTWKSDIKWDQEITDILFISFRNWLEQLQVLSNIRIPRWYFRPYDEGRNSLGSTIAPMTHLTATSANESALQLHVFCDASPSAYAAVAYWRKQHSNASIHVSLIASKSRVAPLKPVTIPRLELQGALLACRLAETIKAEHRIKPTQIYYWTDSTTVLHWIKNENKNYKVFIANRLGEICDLSNISQWYYVPSNLNVADLASKQNDVVLTSNSPWFTGPPFLREEQENWPRDPVKKQKISDEVLEKIHAVSIQDNEHCDLPVPDALRFSSWLRLLRATAAMLLFIDKCRKKDVHDIDSDLLKRAEILLLKYAQGQAFQSEINLLKISKPINRDSRLRALTPYIDSDGLLRVGGRIGAAKEVGEGVKNPIILDGRQHVARLIVRDSHVRAHHAHNEMVVNELRQKYWLLHLRPTVRTVASQCLICRIRKATPVPPRLGDLPKERLMHHQRPFTVCGVDLFGPMEVTVGRQRSRRYGVIFTCMTVRAVHIEIVPFLTADSLIMALRRMAARRGWPHTILSDNGTNMRGADTEMKKAIKEIDEQKLLGQALNKNVTWRFIPPASPHMGGAWERLIRTVKNALKVVLQERAPREEVLTTVLTEVENIINSRPLTHVSVDPQSQEALTPNHFLIGSSSNLPIPGVFDDGDLYLRRQWRIAQRLTDMFWARWVKEVLPVLIPRHKWNQEGLQLNIGDLVIVVDPSSPRNTWPKGIIERVYPGSDGRIRVVDIRTKAGVMKRPVTRVASLIRRDECRSGDTGGENVTDGHALLLKNKT